MVPVFSDEGIGKGEAQEIVAKHGVRLRVHALRAGAVPPATGPVEGATRGVLLYKRKAQPADIPELMRLIGGQPFLVRRALDVVARGVMDFPTLLATADRDDGPFGDHLKRILDSVSQLPEVVEALQASLRSPDLKDAAGYPRLLAAGVVRQRSDGLTELRCEAYRRYLSEHLKAT